MQSRGKIKSVNGLNVIVSVVREGSCGANCAACKGCANRVIDIDAICDLSVKPGDVVEIYTPTKFVILSLIIVYILPIVMPIVLYIATIRFGAVISCIFAILAFAFSVLIIFRLSHSDKYLKKLKATVVQVLS